MQELWLYKGTDRVQKFLLRPFFFFFDDDSIACATGQRLQGRKQSFLCRQFRLMADHRVASIDQASEIFTTDARIIGDSRKKKRKRLVSIAGPSLQRCMIVLRGARDPRTLGATMGEASRILDRSICYRPIASREG